MTLPAPSSELHSLYSRWLRVALLLLLPLMVVFTYMAGFVLIPLVACLLVACTPPAALNWLPHIALLILAFISGLAWGAEVESQLGAGWDQLTIEYRSRRVVPGSFAAFIMWALGVVRVQRPGVFIAVLAGYAGVVILGIEGLWQFLLWLSRQDSSQTRGYIPFLLLGFPSVLFLWSLVPMGFCAICRRFGMHINSGAGMLAGMGFVLAWPLSGLAWLCARQAKLGVMSVDFVNMLTNGSLTPFLIISLGLPILAARSAADVIAASRLKVTPLA